MATTSQLEKLKAVLNELFMLDRADLDFGIYRIMNVKRAEIQRFLAQDLLPQVQAAFAKYQPASQAQTQRELTQTIENARAAGFDPEQSPKVKALREKLAQAVDVSAMEADVYNHLASFFRRYYKDGDFLSLRRYKEGVYAIPYEGEEVKLHWANADQYYIKSSEHLSNYAFKLPAEAPLAGQRVRFELAAASTARDNVKDTDRFFFLHEEEPVAVDGSELVIRFAYRPFAGSKPKQEKLNEESVERVLAAAPGAWQAALRYGAPTAANPGRTLLEKHVATFTARYTFDYFIHKDLEGFLRRELDFYIKNEVLHLDDLEQMADFSGVEQALSKVKVLRQIAHKIIRFLGQFEEFQKKLWLKKKFVLETHWCITLDRIPEEFYAEIAANDAQREEWVKLFAIDEIAESTVGPGYSVPLTVEFLKANDKLVVDTKYLSGKTLNLLLSKIENIDELCDGVLIHSENFQALQLIQNRFYQSIQSIYIDPPYNTSASEIIYKNSYKNSSWLTFLSGRLKIANLLLKGSGVLCVTIDDFEFHRLRMLVEDYYSKENILGVVAIKNNPSGRSTAKGFSIAHEYAIFTGKTDQTAIGRLKHSVAQLARYKYSDEKGGFEWANFRKHGGANANRWARPKLFYPIFISEKSGVRFPNIKWNEVNKEWMLLEQPYDHEIVKFPVTPTGEEKTWKWGIESARAEPDEFSVRLEQGGTLGIYKKARINEEGTLPLTVWDNSSYSSTEYGTNLLKRIFGESEKFSFPKSIFATTDCLRVSNANDDSIVLDYFAGSGTTGHAVINLNREDDGNRRYILVEMGQHFDTALKPRIMKVAYSPDWKDGKPTNRHSGISHMFKYMRLESYEDALDNLVFAQAQGQQALLANPEHAELREEYMLGYLLEMETQGSPSLLNVARFRDPFNYTLAVTREDERRTVTVDLVETFNYLIGLRVAHMGARMRRTADFAADAHGRVQVVDGRTRPCGADEAGWSFRVIQGRSPQEERVLIIWRTLTDNAAQDNAMLDAFFRRQEINPRDSEFDIIYVNGDNNLENLRRPDETWKVRLIEEDFHRLMWEVEDV